jgi:hypothetical protein
MGCVRAALSIEDFFQLVKPRKYEWEQGAG